MMMVNGQNTPCPIMSFIILPVPYTSMATSNAPWTSLFLRTRQYILISRN